MYVLTLCYTESRSSRQVHLVVLFKASIQPVLVLPLSNERRLQMADVDDLVHRIVLILVIDCIKAGEVGVLATVVPAEANLVHAFLQLSLSVP